MILVTGSTGRIGREVVHGLVLQDIQLRVLMYGGAGNEWDHWSNVETVRGDFAKPATLDAALDGIEKAFFVSSPSPKQVELQNAFVDACKRNGVQHVVKISMLGASATAPCRFMRRHHETEAYLAASGMRATNLRPNVFMQGLLANRPTIRDKDAIVATLDPDAQIGMVDTNDVAAVAVRKLSEPQGENETIEITGPAATSMTGAAAAISAAIGRTISYDRVPDEGFATSLGYAGVDTDTAAGILELYAWCNMGAASGITDAVQRITGRAPGTLEAFVERHKNKLT